MSKKESDRDRNPPDRRAERLLAWYRRHRRDLPWRRTRDPYAIWVSEIMLQQTQVAKVEPYFEAFLERYPSVEALADASLEDVLASWSGLGYYRRARFLHRAARELAEAGRPLPRTAEGLLELPGIGAYTAAAIASIAYGEVVPVLDGNVERVLCRLLALAEDPKRSRVRKVLVREARELLDPEDPGGSNQALMELGATICRPRSPRCLLCPLRDFCRGKESPESYPAPKTKRAKELVTLHVALVRRENALLFFRRRESAEVMAGFWELPRVEQSVETAGEPLERARVEERLAERYGGRWQLEDAAGSVKHGITYRSITAYFHSADHHPASFHSANPGPESADGERPEAAWIREEELGDYATSSLVTKILAAADQVGRPRD